MAASLDHEQLRQVDEGGLEPTGPHPNFEAPPKVNNHYRNGTLAAFPDDQPRKRTTANAVMELKKLKPPFVIILFWHV